MRTVAEYRQYASECRQLAAKITYLKDRRAMEMMAAAWEKVAADHEARLKTKVLQ
jgi:hypothetical protein